MKKLTINTLKERSSIIHNGFYNYDLVEYINNRTKVIIICPIHGEFWQKPNNHLLGEGCFECGGKKQYTTETFKIKSNILHNGFYNYDLVEYINNKSWVKIICPVHGLFEQRPMNHLSGEGCRKCYGDRRKLTIDKVVERLTIEEDPIEIGGEIQCRCTYCREYFTPTISQLKSRSNSLSGKQKGESRLYCSDKCKNLCPIYGTSKHYKDSSITKINTSRSSQPELKRFVLIRDNNQCQRCGSSENLHCHHITGAEINPIESADIDNCITLCEKCHGMAHNQNGCGYNDMRRQPCGV